MFCLILLILFFSRRWYWHGGSPYYNSWSHPYGYGYGYPYGAFSYYNPYWNRGVYGAGNGYGYAPYGSYGRW